MKKFFIMIVSVPVLIVSACVENAAPATGTETLRYYADKFGFRVGAPIPGRIWNEDPQYRLYLGKEFNAAVSFVFMKLTQPEQGQFDFRAMDRDIAFAQDHDMKLFGNCLLYRCNTSPDWICSVARRALGRTFGWSPGQLDQIMKNHIETVVRHGGDAYYAWEVVDEPLSHNNPWEEVLGKEQYLAKAFRYAREANPKALLLLNETFGHEGVDRNRTDEFFQLLKRLKSAGVPVDAVGIEMHLEAQHLRPTYTDEFKYFLNSAHEAGVQVCITEMDVYQGPAGAFPDLWDHQRQIYQNILGTCLQGSGCNGFYTWGISDSHSWLAQRENNRLPDAKPLLLDANYERKPAYFGVIDALKNRASHN